MQLPVVLPSWRSRLGCSEKGFVLFGPNHLAFVNFLYSVVVMLRWKQHEMVVLFLKVSELSLLID